MATSPSAAPVQGRGASMPERIGQALRLLSEGAAARGEARAARAKARGAELADPEAAKAERKLAAQNARAMTKLLIPLASIGAQEAIEKAFAQGASPRAYDKGQTPAIAAIQRGHLGLARWLMARPDHVWLGEIHRRAGYNEFSAAVMCDQLDMARELAAARPELVGQAYGSQQYQANLFAMAMSHAPRCAAWLIESGLSGKLPAGHRGDADAQSNIVGLALSLRRGDMATAEALFKFLRPRVVAGKGPLDPSHPAHGLIEAIFEADDAPGLGWLLAKEPRLAQAALEGVVGSAGCAMAYWLDKEQHKELWDRMSAQRSGPHAKALRSTLAAFAACKGAGDCLSLLLSLEEFRAQVPAMQAQPDRHCWESVLLSVSDPSILEALERAGFDIERRMPGGLNHLGAILSQDRATVKWLEFIGRQHPEMLSPLPASPSASPALIGKTAFEMAASSRYASRSLSKWRSICEKAAIRSGAGRASQTKEAKLRSKPRRL